MSERTVVREVREELARGIRRLRSLGEAIQYFYAASDNRHYRMRATFFSAELTDVRTTGQAEHELVYVPRAEAKTAFFHESHAWTVHRV
jgi:hypothetical protein